MKKNLLYTVLAFLPFVAACGSNSITGPSPITTPTPVAQKMTVTITVNGAPVADGSTIHLAGSSNANTVNTTIGVTVDFPSVQGEYQFLDFWWSGRTGNPPRTSVPRTGEVSAGGTNWNGNSGTSGDYKVDVTWFEANGTIDHQVITIHIVFD